MMRVRAHIHLHALEKLLMMLSERLLVRVIVAGT